MIKRRGRLYTRVLEAGRLRNTIRVERRLQDGAAPRPETVTDHLMRIRRAHECRAVTRRRSLARKSRDREIEAPPEKLDGAALADELTSTRGKHSFGLEKNAPEPIREFRIVRTMDGVILEADWRWYLHRHRPDLHRQCHATKCIHDLTIELRDGAGSERQRSYVAIRRPNDELVLDEIELHHKRAIALRQVSGRETSRRQMQRNGPGMIDRRRLRQRD